MIAKYELGRTTIMEKDGVVRTEPDFGGAAPDKWGQIEGRGLTMVLYLDAPPGEHAKIDVTKKR
jgi:hypothetical protein